ncbi:MAG: GDSL-type esterase/lipase family protein [Clostridia bacterium]
MSRSILCYGDSNVWGSVSEWKETSIPSQRYDENTRWTCLLQKQLGADYHVIEEGLCGRTTIYDAPGIEYKNGSPYFLPCLLSHRPLDLVIIMLGSNDLKLVFENEYLGPEVGISRLAEIALGLCECGANHQPPKVLLLSPIGIQPPQGRKDYFAARGGQRCITMAEAFAPAYEKVAAQKGCFFLNGALHGQPDVADGLHLTKASHLSLATAVSKKVTEIFEMSAGI